MSSNWSARRTTQSGTRSRTWIPVIDSTAVRDRFEVLHVERAHHSDPRVEQLEDVLPSLFVPSRTGHVRMGDLVDEGDVWVACEQRVEVHLLEGRTAVLDLLAGNDLQLANRLGGMGAPVGLDVADDDVAPPVAAALALLEHCERLSDASGSTEVDPELPSRRDDVGDVFGRFGRDVGHATFSPIFGWLVPDELTSFARPTSDFAWIAVATMAREAATRRHG